MKTRSLLLASGATLALLGAAACSSEPKETAAARPPLTAGVLYTVKDTVVQASFDAAGTAEPYRAATLSTKLMGTVTAVLVKEGDVVAPGQPLVRLDARDLAAKAAQSDAAIAEAEAVRNDAIVQAKRIRSLYADSAATRAQLDAVETGLVRAEAAVRAAHAGAAELGAVSDYAVIRAPFAGIVTRRFVDPGAFAAPGAPLVEVQDDSRLRVTATATPEAARTVRRGAPIVAVVEGRALSATVEGVVPAPAGNLYTVNAIVPNQGRALLAGSAATVSLPTGERSALLVPVGAVTREGDLTGVLLRTGAGDELRWVRIGQSFGGFVEIGAGLRPGDQVVVPAGQVATMAGER